MEVTMESADIDNGMPDKVKRAIAFLPSEDESLPTILARVNAYGPRVNRGEMPLFTAAVRHGLREYHMSRGFAVDFDQRMVIDLADAIQAHWAAAIAGPMGS